MSESTHKNYTHNIKKFFAFCNKPLEELDEMDVRRFLRHLIQEKNLAPATVNQYGASIRFFFAVSLNRTMNYLQIPLMKVPKTLPDILTREEVHALINVCTNTKHQALLLLAYHPHIHCIVTGGGLTATGKWKASRKKFFLPVKVLALKFRGKFLAFLKLAGFSFPQELYHKDWVVYCKPPFKNSTKVIDYLGRHTHRVAIANSRILQVQDHSVAFSWRDYRNRNRKKIMKLDVLEFIRRFMLHILPPGFRKIRHFGILASRNKSARISLRRKLTDTSFLLTSSVPVIESLPRKMLGADFDLCPCCQIGRLSRASPNRATA